MAKYDKLSKDFHADEFACQGMSCCGGVAPMNPALIAGLQELRDMVSQPIIISSGFRCFVHNTAIGSNNNSQHPRGKAADIFSHHIPPKELARAAEKIPAFENGGIGVYDTFIHVDVRDGRARW